MVIGYPMFLTKYLRKQCMTQSHPKRKNFSCHKNDDIASFSYNNKISNVGKIFVHVNRSTMLFIRALYVAHEKVDSKKTEF